ncbi:MAG TPA: CcmD family protein [Cytophagaceae bacterium]|jgi:CcmD family protein|nr:CcmD family protein [Cytophagaceae bacterium]
MKLHKYIGFVVLLFAPLLSKAQEVEMADTFRKDGKIYVVISVAAIILVGIFVYLFLLDKKISKIEKQIKK